MIENIGDARTNRPFSPESCLKWFSEQENANGITFLCFVCQFLMDILLARQLIVAGGYVNVWSKCQIIIYLLTTVSNVTSEPSHTFSRNTFHNFAGGLQPTTDDLLVQKRGLTVWFVSLVGCNNKFSLCSQDYES